MDLDLNLSSVFQLIGFLAVIGGGAAGILAIECQLDPMRTGKAPTRGRVALMWVLLAMLTAALLAFVVWGLRYMWQGGAGVSAEVRGA